MQSIAISQQPVEASLCRLNHGDRPDIEKHLLDLDPVSRNRRFHCGFGDAAVAAYVQKLDLTAGVVVAAIESGSGRIVGLGEAHPSDVPKMVEVGASVLATHRRRGLGHRLIAQAVAAAVEQGATEARLSFDPMDPAVTRIVAKLGARNCSPGLAVLQAEEVGSLLRPVQANMMPAISPKAPAHVPAQ